VPDTDERAVRAPDPSHEISFRRSLRASRERRAGAARRRRRVLRGRRGLALALSGLAIAATGALAADAGPAPVAQTLAVQKALGISADGIYGPQTRGAIRRFQRAHGIAVTGVAGPDTLAALGITAAQSAASTTTAPAGLLDQIARCESGGDPTAISGSGQYRGKYQFDRATWAAVGGKGDPAAAPEAEQDRRAATLLARQGPSAWPNCA
jgi:hypothetical protein